MIHDSVTFLYNTNYCGRLCFSQTLAPRTVKVRTALSRPDRIKTGKIRTDRHRKAFVTKFRTTDIIEADTRRRIRTLSRQRTDTGQDLLDNSDKSETKTGHGQRCPPTSGFSYPCLPGSTKLETDSSLFCNWGWAYRR